MTPAVTLHSKCDTWPLGQSDGFREVWRGIVDPKVPLQPPALFFSSLRVGGSVSLEAGAAIAALGADVRRYSAGFAGFWASEVVRDRWLIRPWHSGMATPRGFESRLRAAYSSFVVRRILG